MEACFPASSPLLLSVSWAACLLHRHGLSLVFSSGRYFRFRAQSWVYLNFILYMVLGKGQRSFFTFILLFQLLCWEDFLSLLNCGGAFVKSIEEHVWGGSVSGWFHFLLLTCRNALYILDASSWSGTCVVNIFSQSVHYLFTFVFWWAEASTLVKFNSVSFLSLSVLSVSCEVFAYFNSSKVFSCFPLESL